MRASIRSTLREYTQRQHKLLGTKILMVENERE